MTSGSFDDLVAEAASAPVAGWDFSWLDGRATEERPPWRYSELLPARIAAAGSVLDVQTGGGEVFAGALAAAHHRPDLIRATESWEPNLALARRALAPFRAEVRHSADRDPLPFDGGAFELVISRHPTFVDWDEIARVLMPGGAYLSQHVVGLETNRELYEFMMGPQPRDPVPGTERIAAAVAAAGLDLVDLRYQESRLEFFDVGAIVYFLRKVIWTVPDFDVERYSERLRAADSVIRDEGAFVSYSRHALIEARRP